MPSCLRELTVAMWRPSQVWRAVKINTDTLWTHWRRQEQPGKQKQRHVWTCSRTWWLPDSGCWGTVFGPAPTSAPPAVWRMMGCWRIPGCVWRHPTVTLTPWCTTGLTRIKLAQVIFIRMTDVCIYLLELWGQYCPNHSYNWQNDRWKILKRRLRTD